MIPFTRQTPGIFGEVDVAFRIMLSWHVPIGLKKSQIPQFFFLIQFWLQNQNRGFQNLPLPPPPSISSSAIKIPTPQKFQIQIPDTQNKRKKLQMISISIPTKTHPSANIINPSPSPLLNHHRPFKSDSPPNQSRSSTFFNGVRRRPISLWQGESPAVFSEAVSPKCEEIH